MRNYSNSQAKLTANFGVTPFKYPMPSGYSQYDAQGVNKSVITVTSISIDNSSVSLNVYYTATVYPIEATNKGITWSSSDTTIATVDSTEKITAVKPGTAIITASTLDGGYKAHVLLLIVIIIQK